ncbi:MAG TPA: hypothetical protein VHK47_20650 [Polyangia bacterium]|jgi:hypothetical protein|nr:hypothetical protein [Polyangia bacterium]
MRTSILTLTCVLGAIAAACSPLRQPLGSLTGASAGQAGNPGTAGSGNAGTSGGGTAGSAIPKTNQIPSIPPEWNDCDPNATRCYRDPGVSPSSPVSELFGGAPDPDPAAKPVIVYPLDGAMHPINSADITFQWRRGPAAAQTVFRIRLRRVGGDVFEFFVPCKQPAVSGPPVNTECVYRLPPGAWLDLATTTRGESLVVDVAGVDLTRPGVVATSDSMTLAFSPEDVRGGFYYWSVGVNGTERVLFGTRTPQPFVSHKLPDCSGCHALSRDGARFAFEQGDTASGVLWVAPTATPQPQQSLFTPSATHDAGTQALNHDGTRVLVSTSGRLTLRDAATNKVLTEVTTNQLGMSQHAFHPEWSPDDRSVVVTVSALGDSDWSVRTGAIGVLPFQGDQFGNVDIVVPTGTATGDDFNFYPTWSPDGHWIAFATAPIGPMQTSYKQINARLRLVNRDTKIVYDLAAASGSPGHGATMPKFAPFTQAGGLMILTFHSKLDYGFYVTGAGTAQLWMTVIDVGKLHVPTDEASRPPVWLPFQDWKSGNYAGVWAETVGCHVENGTSVGCGDGEICNQGACAMVGP